MDKYEYNSPIGKLKFCICDEKLSSLEVCKESFSVSKESEFSLKVKKELDEYFAGKRKTFDIQINVNGTEFQKRVWNILANIPYGKTMTYSEIAIKLGNEKASRAVGNACNKNPILILIPCHRVIGKNGNLTGFACGMDKKRILLNIEFSGMFK